MHARQTFALKRRGFHRLGLHCRPAGDELLELFNMHKLLS